MATAVDPESSQDDHHDDWHHKRFSAHHFDSAEQQFDSGKLGMWIFLVTEILFFSGLFCAYAVYRANHPEVFQYASQYLDKYLGGMNTIVLIFSSLTMAWAVRCAQLGQRRGLISMLAITLFCAALFLGVKTFEYTEKAHKRLMWAGAFVNATDIGKNLGMTTNDKGEEVPKTHVMVYEADAPSPEGFEKRVMASLAYIQRIWGLCCVIPIVILGIGYWKNSRPARTTGWAILLSIIGIMGGIAVSVQIHQAQHGGDHKTAHADEAGHAEGEHAAGEHADDDHDHAEGEQHDESEETAVADSEAEGEETTESEEMTTANVPEMAGEGNLDEPGDQAKSDAPRNANLFFSIYYFMTGLHAFHIVCGMIAITWLLVRSVEGHFRPDYFGPVDYVGLYWHIVDLIWIYLFPLLYLIGK